jgi:signal transduction histidine kinase/CheY-like chemotaxis protein
VVLTGRGVGAAHELHDGAVIGRDSACEIRIHDFDASRRHARVRQLPSGEWELEDLASRNGTEVNGKPIERRTLVPGDRIQIGTYCTLLYSRFDAAEDQFLEAQKLEAMGRLAGGIVHDFNNLLGAMLVGLDLLREEPSPIDPEERRAILDDVAAAAERAGDLTRRLTSFARRDSVSSGVVGLTVQLKDAAALVQRAAAGRVALDLQIAPGLTVVGDAPQLQQLWRNLLANARDAMPNGGTITVVARRLDSGLIDGAPLPHVGEGPYILVSIRDTGEGMSDEVRRHAFEPFFTTKGGRAGTGLGLAVAYGVVRAHGGSLSATSTPGEGAELRVLLPAGGVVPAVEEPWRSSAIGSRTAPPPGHALVVDDDDLVRRSTARLLRRLGFQVVEASGGRAAVTALGAAPEGFQIAVVDLDMPDLDGIATMRELRAIQSDLRILAVSGAGAAARGREALAAGARGFLQKPFQHTGLLDALWSAITDR